MKERKSSPHQVEHCAKHATLRVHLNEVAAAGMER
jgi:hypothetical protein